MEKVTESVRLRVHRAGRGALVTLGREALSPRLACEHRWPEGLAGGKPMSALLGNTFLITNASPAENFRINSICIMKTNTILRLPHKKKKKNVYSQSFPSQICHEGSSFIIRSMHACCHFICV